VTDRPACRSPRKVADVPDPNDLSEICVVHYTTWNDARAQGGWELPLPDSGHFVLPGFAGPSVTFDPWPVEPVGHSGLVGYTVSRLSGAARPWRWCMVIRTDESQLAFDHGRRPHHDRGYSCKCRFGSGEVLFTGKGDAANDLLRRLRPDSWPELREPVPPPPPYDYAAAVARERAFRAEMWARHNWRPTATEQRFPG